MVKPRIFIVEDEPLIADDIEATLQELGYEVTGQSDNAIEAIELIAHTIPDLILLDISISGEKDGIDLARHINLHFKIPFVFLTSHYDQATLDRVKLTSPHGFIVKPFDEGDIKSNIDLALFRFAQQRGEQKASALEKVFVRQNQDLISLEVKNILFVEAYDNYAYIQTTTEKFLISHTLKSVEEKLPSAGFLRVHRSYLINFAFIKSISEGYVFLEQHKVPIGKAYRQELMDKISLL